MISSKYQEIICEDVWLEKAKPCYSAGYFNFVDKFYSLYCKDGLLHRKNLPAYFEKYKHVANKIKEIKYFVDGKLHRLNGPAFLYYYTNGNLYVKTYCVNGALNRPGNNKPTYYYYFNNGQIRSKYFHVNNNLHNINGPAYIAYDGLGSLNKNIKEKHYYLNGKMYDFEQWKIQK